MRRSLSHPLVRTEHTPIDLTHTPLDIPLSGAQLQLSAGPHLPTPHATAAHGHTPNQHRFCDCSSCPSIHRDCGDRVSHFYHSSHRAVSPLGAVPTHNHVVIRTGCSCQSANEATATPLCSCVPRCSKLTGHSDNSILAHTSWHRLSFHDLVSRSLRHSFAFSSASCPGGILKLSHRNRHTYKFPTLVSNRGLLRPRFERFASSKEFLLGPCSYTWPRY